MPDEKLIIEFATPRLCPNHCLPHAAMNLGNHGGYGKTPREFAAKRLVIEPSFGAWHFIRLDAGGGYVNDSWHDSREDALHQAKLEFGDDLVFTPPDHARQP